MSMSNADPVQCELLVIGRGMAGMAAALFSANRGLSTVQVGMTGELIFASGLLDLLGVHPIQEQNSWSNPWQGIEALVRDIPEHPYARLKREEIQGAFDEILTFLEEHGLPYCKQDLRNSQALTPVGTVKQTYCVPKTMWNGVKALKEKSSCLLVDFQGLHDFSARQIVATMGDRWPDLRAARIPFPGPNEAMDLVTGEITAANLELSRNREKLVQNLQPHLKDSRAVGMPAILGMNRSNEIVADLEERMGVPVFEVPTLPISLPGLRLNDTFTRGLLDKGVRPFSQNRVWKAKQGFSDDFVIRIGENMTQQRIRANGILLATGRFWGKGLRADRKGVHEAIFDLPLRQPADRNEWHHPDFLDARGHPINRAGIEVDNDFRPVDSTGRPVLQNLFAAGSILAHQDWMRMKCGSGLAIATAYGAVNAFLRNL